MALKHTDPIGSGSGTVVRTIKATFNWVTSQGASVLKTLPLGGAFGVVTAGIVLWFAPRLVPEGWSAEAVLSLGMGSGVVLHRLLDSLFGWFLEPVRRHLGARWEAVLRLGKLERYRTRGMLPAEEAQVLTSRIVRDDITSKRPRR